ncbi:hypothetical protein K3495_g5387 [Podosphaera aphanis]|nr:hypothetical protein K3495_g5387 [Podosphaera aphanis]
MDSKIHDVIIVGAGPCGLALASRLREQTPGSLFSDSEHQRFHFIKASSHSRQNNKPIHLSRRSKTATDRLVSGPPVKNGDLDMIVLDAHGEQWMQSWNKNFEKLRISHLRSPMFFHPDPSDRDGLRAFAFLEGRMDELREIEGVIGKELSKHQRKQKQKASKKTQQNITYLDERFRDDYFRPSQSLFKAYCEEIVNRYDLSNIIEKSRVNSISFDSTQDIFTLQTSTGTKKCRIVILAIGSDLKPSLPPNCPFTDSKNVVHILDSNVESLPTELFERPRNSLLIVGGGLTSAQIAKLAADRGVSKIYLTHRGALKTKHFDVDLHWLAKFKNKSMSEFFYADSDEERFEMMKAARGGGSVNPEFRNIIQMLQKLGILILKENTEVCGARRDSNGSRWIVNLRKKDESIEDIQVDYVIYATGTPVNISSLPFIQPFLTQYPIDTVGGMPCVTDELMWKEEVPLFVTGKLGGLRLGPAAGNLEGARVGAEFIAGKIAELVSLWTKKAENFEPSIDHLKNGVDMRTLGLGHTNQFDILS